MIKYYLMPFGNSVVKVKTNLDGSSEHRVLNQDPANTDYQNFKKEVLAGAELQDADGNLMTLEEAKVYVATLG
jgi:hypothetical protein